MMDEQNLMRLAEFFGVEATAEAVLAALEEMRMQLTQATSEDSAMSAEQEAYMGGLRSALKAKDDDELMLRLDAIKSALEITLGESEPEPVPDFSAIAEAAKAAATAKNKPLNLPGYRGNGNSNGFNPAKKNTPFQAPNINRGAEKPGLGAMVRGMFAQKGVAGMDRFKGAYKAQSAAVGPLGGYLTGHEVSSDILEQLEAKAVVMEAGARRLPLAGLESYTLIKDKSGATAYYVGENQQIPDSNVQFTTITIHPRTLAARVLIPGRLLRNATVNLDAYIRENVERKLRLRMDRDIFLGIGAVNGSSDTDSEPLGMLNMSDVTTAVDGTPTLDDLINAVGRVEDANIDATSGAWFFAPRTKRTFTSMTDDSGMPILRQSWGSGEDREIIGYPYFTTTQIPITSNGGITTTGGSDSFIFFANMDNLLVAMSEDIEIAVDEAQYFDRDQYQIRAMMSWDFVTEYTEAVEVLTGIEA